MLFPWKTKSSVLYYAHDSFEISSMANKKSLTSVTFSVLLAPHGFHLQQLCCSLNEKKNTLVVWTTFLVSLA